jgi:quercetin dioxygenase-like cupin family protein
VVSGGAGAALWIFQDLVEIKITGEQTAGAYSVLEDWPAPTYSPQLHIHVAEDELVQILDGEFTLATEAGERKLSAGDVVRVPKGTPHAFRNTGERSGHRLVLFVPAGPERLWAEVGVPAENRDTPPPNSTDPAAFLAAAKRHGLVVLGSRRRQSPDDG